jgi:hypothetical protein
MRHTGSLGLPTVFASRGSMLQHTCSVAWNEVSLSGVSRSTHQYLPFTVASDGLEKYKKKHGLEV